MQSDSIKKTLLVSVGICFVCSILVSSAAVSLKKIQDDNKRIDKIKNILLAGDLLSNSSEEKDVEKIFKGKVKSAIVNIEQGKEMPATDELNAENFDIKTMADDSKLGEQIPTSKDIAGIKRKPKNMVIYKVYDDSNIISKIIFPIYGKGLWSTMYGFIAIDKDLKTVRGFTFYEHGETPGLGGEVDNPKWKAIWKGKQAYNDKGEVIMEVIKGSVDVGSPNATHQVDGLSGSTLTTRGVDNLVRFWLGKNGYEKYINNLKEKGDI